MALTAEGRTADRLADLERHQRRFDAGSLNRSIVVVAVSDGTASLPDSSGQFMSFSTVDVDTADVWNPADPTAVTVPSDGVYMLAGSAQIDPSGSSTGLRTLQIVASTSPTTQVGFTLPPLPSNGWRAAPATVARLEAGDTVQLFAFQTSGGTLDASSGRLSVVWIGAS